MRACEGKKCVCLWLKSEELAALRFKCRFNVMKKHNMLKMMKCKKCMKHRNEADVAERRDGRTVRPCDLMVEKTLIYLIFEHLLTTLLCIYISALRAQNKCGPRIEPCGTQQVQYKELSFTL